MCHSVVCVFVCVCWYCLLCCTDSTDKSFFFLRPNPPLQKNERWMEKKMRDSERERVRDIGVQQSDKSPRKYVCVSVKTTQRRGLSVRSESWICM